MIVGVVLAAGRSRRMGRTKALLPFSADTFLGNAVHALSSGGCERVLVVTGPHGDADVPPVLAAARSAGAIPIVNPDRESPQIESLRTALRALPAEVAAVLVTPVDVPVSGGETAAALIGAFRARGAPVVLPVHGGKRGHPALFARAVFADLLREPLPEGARTVIDRYEAELEVVPVEDAAISVDIDTPAEYRRLRGES